MFKRMLLALLLVMVATATAAAAPPAPKLKYVGKVQGFAGFVQYNLTVLNWQSYPPAMFVASPQLPPCGINFAASRTFVDIYNAQTNARIYGHCNFTSNLDLKNKIWFATLHPDTPKFVYIVLTDRVTNISLKSNVVPLN